MGRAAGLSGGFCEPLRVIACRHSGAGCWDRVAQPDVLRGLAEYVGVSAIALACGGPRRDAGGASRLPDTAGHAAPHLPARPPRPPIRATQGPPWQGPPLLPTARHTSALSPLRMLPNDRGLPCKRSHRLHRAHARKRVPMGKILPFLARGPESVGGVLGTHGVQVSSEQAHRNRSNLVIPMAMRERSWHGMMSWRLFVHPGRGGGCELHLLQLDTGTQPPLSPA